MKKGRFSAFPPIPPFGACSVGRLFAFSHIESYFRPLGWDASKSVPHRPCFSVIYVGRCFRFTHRNGQNRGLMWDFAFSGLRGRAVAMWERRPAPAARGMTGSAIPCPAPLHYMTRKLASPCFQGAWAPHRIHWTAGKLTSRLQSKHGVRRGADAGCSFPDGHAQRSRRREQREQPGGGVRTRVPIDCRLTQIPMVTRGSFYVTISS